MMRRSKLYFRGILVLIILWAMIYALVIGIYALTLYYGTAELTAIGVFGTALPILVSLGLIFLIFLISPWMMDLSFSWVYSLSWIQPEQLPPHLASFIAEQSKIHGISIKKVGMIHDQMPTALTYGRFKKNARLVISDGILNLLTPEEQIAVVGHELGHIAHLDFFFMTLASAVPLILYNIYGSSRAFARHLSYVARKSDSRDKSGGYILGMMAAAYAIAIAAFLLYLLSNFLVLFLSRIREYYADNFSGRNTKNPKALSTALVKIAYGMVQAQSNYSTTMNSKTVDPRVRTTAYRRFGFTNATRALNIFDVKAAGGLVMTAYTQKQEINPEAVARAAAFDLENPWATFLELQSTHPLTAKRLMALDDLAIEMGMQPAFPTLGEKQVRESLWDEFFIDIFLLYGGRFLVVVLPAVGAIGFLYSTMYGMLGVAGGLLLNALLWWWRVSIQYPKLNYEMMPIYIMDAVTDVSDDGYVEASPFRGKPIKLQGTVIGRATPGYYFSEDMVLQDPSGIITLDYNPLFGFMRWIMALFRVDKVVGSQVEVIGWYRRSMRPCVEIKRIILPSGKSWTTYRDLAQKLLILLFLAGALVLTILALPI